MKFGIRSAGEIFATRNQIQELYNVPKKTLAGNIKTLKEDGLINGAKIRHVANDGKQRVQEVFDLNEVIAMGFRLRSDKAIRLQRYAADLLMEKIKSMDQERRMLEIELSYAWNKSDRDDLYH